MNEALVLSAFQWVRCSNELLIINSACTFSNAFVADLTSNKQFYFVPSKGWNCEVRSDLWSRKSTPAQQQSCQTLKACTLESTISAAGLQPRAWRWQMHLINNNSFRLVSTSALVNFNVFRWSNNSRLALMWDWEITNKKTLLFRLESVLRRAQFTARSQGYIIYEYNTDECPMLLLVVKLH